MYLKEAPVFTGIFDLLHGESSLFTIDFLQVDNWEIFHSSKCLVDRYVFCVCVNANAEVDEVGIYRDFNEDTNNCDQGVGCGDCLQFLF